MTTQLQTRRMPPRRWATLDVSETRTSYILRSRTKGDAARRTAEMTLTGAAILLLIGAYLLIILPQVQVVERAALPGYVLPMTMVALALGLYAFATRGHTPEVRLDKVRDEIWICARNSKFDARIQTRLAKSDIQSMFIQRPKEKTGDAAIMARINGKARPTCLVRGRLDEIELAYQDLCIVLTSAPKKPSRSFTSAILPRRVARASRVAMR